MRLRLLLLFFVVGAFSSCNTLKQTPSVNGVKSDINAANDASTRTGQKIKSVRNNVEKIDYKASRAKDLLDKGIERPF